MSDTLTLKEATIVHDNGEQEKVFVPLGTSKLTWRDHLQLVYILMGTLVLGLTAYSILKRTKK